MRRAGAYLTDNVVIVRQVLRVSLGGGRRGVTQFPYVWLRAVGGGGDGEAVGLRLAALWAVLAAGGQRGRQARVVNICSLLLAFLCIGILPSFYLTAMHSVRLGLKHPVVTRVTHRKCVISV